MSQSARYHPAATSGDDIADQYAYQSDNSTSTTIPGQRYESYRGAGDTDGGSINLQQQQKPQLHHQETSDSSSSWENLAKTLHVDSLRPSRHAGEWRPKAFSYIYFAITISFVVCILVAAELVLHRSQEKGYVFLPTDGKVDDLPLAQNFAYQYLPTLVGVLYGTIWALVWHEVQRLEPWYQLSKPSGATLDDSLALTYKGSLPFVVPFKAFQRRHWAILCGSLTFMLSSFGLTPLLGAGFAVKTITVSRPEIFVTNSSFLHPNLQKTLTAEFMYDAYDTAWLNASLPAYTTQEYGIAPFNLRDTSEKIGDIPVFKARTTIYTSDVKCQTSRLQPKKNASDPFEINVYLHPTKNCSAGSYITTYFGYFHAVWCKDQNIFAGNWSLTNRAEKSIVFCDVDYSSAPATVYYAPSNTTVVNITDIGTFTQLNSSVFNSTLYNRVIGGLVNPVTSPRFPITWFPPGVQQVKAYAPDSNNFYPYITPVISQGIGIRRQNIQDYTLQDFIDTVTIGHKSLFAHAIPYLLDKSPGSSKALASSTTRGTQSQTGEAVVAVKSIIIVVEVICGLVLVMMVALMVSVKRRRNNLLTEPASIGALMSLVSRSRALREHFTGLDEADDAEIKRLLPKEKYRLQVWEDGSANGTYKLDIDSSEGTHYHDPSDSRKEEKSTPNDLPFILRPLAALLVLVFIVITIGLVAGFTAYSKSNNGLPLVGKILLVEQLVYSYIPIGISQLFGMIWGEILGTLSVLQPWISMSQHPTPSISSLSVKYTAVPPALLLPRSIKGGHYFLALGSIMPWTSYVLPVLAGALFSRKFTTTSTPVPLARVVQPKFEPAYTHFSGFDINTAMGRPGFNDDDFTGSSQTGPHVYDNRIKDMYASSLFDQFEGLRANFTREVVPAWSSVGIYFTPFSYIGNSRGNITGDTIRGTTTGFEGSLDCEELAVGGKYKPWLNTSFSNTTYGYRYTYALNLTASVPDFTKPYSASRETKQQKVMIGSQYLWNSSSDDSLNGGSGGLSSQNVWSKTTGKASLELEPLMIADLQPPNGVYNASGPALKNSDFRQVMQWSQALLVAGYVRTNTDNEKYQEKWIICHQVPLAARYDVTLDPTGKVLNYKQIGNKEDIRTVPEKYFATEAELYRFLSSTSNLFQNSSSVTARNTSAPNSWKTLVLGDVAEKSGYGNYLDPGAPLYNTTVLANVYAETYKRLFPIILAQNRGVLLRGGNTALKSNNRITPVSRSQSVVDGTASIISSTERFFASSAIAIALISLLILNIAVAVAVYVGSVGIVGFGRRYRGMKMRAPLTVGMLLARVYDSDALRDVEGTERMREEEREGWLRRNGGGLYGYGAVVGRGGEGGVQVYRGKVEQ